MSHPTDKLLYLVNITMRAHKHLIHNRLRYQLPSSRVKPFYCEAAMPVFSLVASTSLTQYEREEKKGQTQA